MGPQKPGIQYNSCFLPGWLHLVGEEHPSFHLPITVLPNLKTFAYIPFSLYENCLDPPFFFYS